jgi:tripartite-type tricarboxylate transporter receptor subunit TctC
LNDPSTRQRLLDLGGIIPDDAARKPEALAAFVTKEVARWTPILKKAGVVAE